MSKATTAAILKAIDQAWHEADARIQALSDNAGHPTHAAMIEKNKGYKLALEDATEIIHAANRKGNK